ncbi:MAG: rhomboid family intramembrane serine protease [Chlamydiales bacterium]
MIWAISLFSLFCPILTFLMNHYLKIPGPLQWFTLSIWGLKHGWFWQFLTYFFIHSLDTAISLSFLISLFFKMVLLWCFGSEIEFRFGKIGLFLFYLSGGLVAGIVSTTILLLFSSQFIIYGIGPSIYGLMIIWTMLHPDLELDFSFLLHIKFKSLIPIFLGIIILMDLSYGNFISSLLNLIGIGWGFFFGRIIWKLPNPYSFNLGIFQSTNTPPNSEKIIDLTVMQESDEAFMDRMLDKIGDHGEDSLTYRERERMKNISKSKDKKH